METGWTRHSANDKFFYYHKSSKTSVWKVPLNFHNWIEMKDTKSERTFFFSRVQNVSKWKCPQDEEAIITHLTKEEDNNDKEDNEDNEDEKSNSPRSAISSHHESGREESEESEGDEDWKQEETSLMKKDKEDMHPVTKMEGTRDDDDTSSWGNGEIVEDNYEETAMFITDRLEQPNVEDNTMEVEEKIDGGKSAANAILEQWARKDAIMDVNVLESIAAYLKLSENYGPEMIISSLTGSYRGYAQMAELAGTWLNSIPKKQKTSSKFYEETKQDEKAEDFIYTFLKSLIVQRYEPKMFEDLFDSEKSTANTAPPEWLEMMLQDPQWRLLLIELAEKHKSCSLLHYAVQSISRAGHHKEIASVTSASTYFSVFHGVFLDTLSRLHLSSNEELDRDMKNLKNICRQSAYTYLYISELCRRVEGHGEMEKVVVEKVRCIRQELEQITSQYHAAQMEPYHLLQRSEIRVSYPTVSSSLLAMISEHKVSYEISVVLLAAYKPSDETLNDTMEENIPLNIPPASYLRDPTVLEYLIDALFNPYYTPPLSTEWKSNLIWLLAYAVCAQDERKTDCRVTKNTISTLELEETRLALEAASGVCKSDHTLGYNIQQSGIVDELETLMHSPVVSMGVLHWIHSALTAPLFHKSALLLVCFPSFLTLLRNGIRAHPLQWPQIFAILHTSLELQPELNPIKLLDLKRDTLDVMVYLMLHGYVFPVLSFVTDGIPTLDQALLRNFVGSILRQSKAPFSSSFATALTILLVHPKVTNALKTSAGETQKALGAFIKYARNTPGLLSKAHTHALKGVKGALG